MPTIIHNRHKKRASKKTARHGNMLDTVVFIPIFCIENNVMVLTKQG